MKIKDIMGENIAPSGSSNQQPPQIKTGAEVKPLPGPNGTTAVSGPQQTILGTNPGQNTVTIGDKQTGQGQIVQANRVQQNPDGSYSLIAQDQSNAGAPQQMGATPPMKEEPGSTGSIASVNTRTTPPMVLDNATGGSPLTLTKTGEEITPQLIARSHPDWQERQIQANGKVYTALYSGTQGYRVGKQAYQQIMGGAQRPGFEETIDPDSLTANHDIGGKEGGDKTDAFIDQVTDKKFTRAQRDPVKSTFNENDPLYKMLTIAGLK